MAVILIVRPWGLFGRPLLMIADLPRIPWTLIVFLVAASVPWLGSRYDTFLAEQIAIDALFAVSLNLLLGTTGLVSFGHVAYFGVGAYVCGILMKTYELPFIVAFPAAGLGTAAFALVSGYFCVRLIKLYFAMLTLAFSQIVWAICYKWNDVTGGDQGLPEIPFPDLDWMSAIPGWRSSRSTISSICLLWRSSRSRWRCCTRSCARRSAGC